MRISDWSSDVCSSDLRYSFPDRPGPTHVHPGFLDRLIDGYRPEMMHEEAGSYRIDMNIGEYVIDIHRPAVGLCRIDGRMGPVMIQGDRKSTRLNSSH